MTRLIGILGGTFDPVHYGHLRPVSDLARQLKFFRVHYVLSARPPHRNPPVASITHRYNMLKLALDAYPQFVPDDQEIQRPGPSFTVWTIRKMRQRYRDDCLCLILGMDAYLGMHKWYRWPDIIALANIVVLPRPGWKRDRCRGTPDAVDLAGRTSGTVFYADARELPITATEIRRKLGEGQNLSDEIPDEVLTYIRRNQIYRN